MEGKLKEAMTEIDQAKALWEKSRDFHQHFDIGVVSARILAQNHDPSEAEKQLNLLLDESTRDGLVSHQFEIRLALGEIEMKSGEPRRMMSCHATVSDTKNWRVTHAAWSISSRPLRLRSSRAQQNLIPGKIPGILNSN
jgi:hypothetical protein